MASEPNQPPTPGFFEERTGWRRLRELLLLEPLPGGARWAAAFGSLLLFAFVVQVVTGILLSMNYAPSEKSAWDSVNYIQQEVPLGAFIRALHHWGASAMVVLLLAHLVQVFVWGAYKRPREFTWMVGVLLLLGTLGLAFTGYLLPWDQKAYWATKVGLGITGMVPLIGEDLRNLLQGGSQIGNLTLTRFFTLHGFILPGAIILLAVVHLYLFRQHGVTPPWWRWAAQLQADKVPFWPRQALKDGVVALVFLVSLGAWAYFHRAPLEAPADPSQPYEARPEWYFMFLFQLLRYFHGPLEVVGTFVLPTLFFLILLFWPFLDRNPHRNPMRRPLAMTLLGAGTTGLVGLTIFAIATDTRMQEPAQAVAKAPPTPEPAGPIQKLEVAQLYSARVRRLPRRGWHRGATPCEHADPSRLHQPGLAADAVGAGYCPSHCGRQSAAHAGIPGQAHEGAKPGADDLRSFLCTRSGQGHRSTGGRAPASRADAARQGAGAAGGVADVRRETVWCVLPGLPRGRWPGQGAAQQQGGPGHAGFHGCEMANDPQRRRHPHGAPRR